MSTRHVRFGFVIDDVTEVKSGASYQMVNDAGVVVNKTSGSATAVSLPKLAAHGTVVFIKDGKGDAGTNAITVTDPNSKTIDGASSLVLNTNYAAAWLVWDALAATPEWKLINFLSEQGTGNAIFNNVTLTGLLNESAASGITAGTTRNQAGATALTKEVNRVDTSTAPAAGSTLGDGVALMAATAGLDVTVINNTANLITVYPNGTDQINGQGASVGVPIPAGDVAQFECSVAGDWRYEAGMGSSGVLPVELAADSISAAGANQAAATQLVAALNRVTTATANQGVKLPASAAGMDVIVENHSGVPITVYGAGTDTIDDVATATGVIQMDSSVVIYTCYAPGRWYSNGLATGYAKNPQSGVVLETVQFADGISAAGSSQGTATQLIAAVNTVSTVGAGQGVNLPASSPGLTVIVQNTGANALTVYPAQGSSDTINGVAAASGVTINVGSTASFNCTAAGAWNVMPASAKQAAFNSAANTSGFTATGAQITGGTASVDFALTGTLGAGANLTLPTVANLVLAMHSPAVGSSYRLRVINRSSANFAWTAVTNTGWTLTGTMTVAQNTFRDFVVTLTSLTTATLQAVGTGTDS